MSLAGELYCQQPLPTKEAHFPGGGGGRGESDKGGIMEHPGLGDFGKPLAQLLTNDKTETGLTQGAGREGTCPTSTA